MASRISVIWRRVVLCGKLFPKDKRVRGSLNCGVLRAQAKFNLARFSELLKGKIIEYLRLSHKKQNFIVSLVTEAGVTS